MSPRNGEPASALTVTRCSSCRRVPPTRRIFVRVSHEEICVLSGFPIDRRAFDRRGRMTYLDLAQDSVEWLKPFIHAHPGMRNE